MLKVESQFLMVSWYFWLSLTAMVVTSARALALLGGALDIVRTASLPDAVLAVSAVGGLLVSVAVGYLISSIFRFFFSLVGGYSILPPQKMVKMRVINYLSELAAVSDPKSASLNESLDAQSAKLVEKLDELRALSPSAIESFLLYNYSSAAFIAWVRRRFEVFLTDMSVACAIFAGIAAGFVIDRSLGEWQWLVVVFAALYVLMLVRNGIAPIGEVKQAEKLMCEMAVGRFARDIGVLPVHSNHSSDVSSELVAMLAVPTEDAQQRTEG